MYSDTEKEAALQFQNPSSFYSQIDANTDQHDLVDGFHSYMERGQYAGMDGIDIFPYGTDWGILIKTETSSGGVPKNKDTFLITRSGQEDSTATNDLGMLLNYVGDYGDMTVYQIEDNIMTAVANDDSNNELSDSEEDEIALGDDIGGTESDMGDDIDSVADAGDGEDSGENEGPEGNLTYEIEPEDEDFGELGDELK